MRLRELLLAVNVRRPGQPAERHGGTAEAAVAQVLLMLLQDLLYLGTTW